MEIKIADALDLSRKVLNKYGYTDEESKIISKSLIWAQKRGSTQGLNKLFGWKIQKPPNAKNPFVEKDDQGSMLINAGLGNHILACDFAVKKLFEQITNTSIFMVGVKNTDNSAGALGYYTEQIAMTGYVAIMLSAADPGVVAHGGKSPVLGTNPISISVPTKDDPLLLDMSTAALTWGDLIKYDYESKPLPEGLAFDNQGSPTTDPKKAMEGFVTTFDKSYKSSGLALMIQILAGPLVGSIYSKDYNFCQYGSLIIAINPAAFGDKDSFLEKVVSLVKEIKESGNQVVMPGERGYQKAEEATKKDSLEISPELFSRINEYLNSDSAPNTI